MDDVFSKGFICPKGSTLKQLHEDPDRLRVPLIKRDGVHVEATWAEAWAAIERGLGGVAERHGRECVAVYVGNPSAHSLSSMIFSRVLMTGLGTRHRFSASTVDQMPRHVASGHVFGSPVAIPVPDLDRTDYLVMLGANPYASNGSMCTAPDFPGPDRGDQGQRRQGRRGRSSTVEDRRGVRRVGVDPSRLRRVAAGGDRQRDGEPTASPTRESTSRIISPASTSSPPRSHRSRPNAWKARPESTRPRSVGWPTRSRRARSAAVYGRIGTTTTEFGSTASWMIDAVNILSGNLDRAGGAMFSTPVAGGPLTRGKPGLGSRILRSGADRRGCRAIPR